MSNEGCLVAYDHFIVSRIRDNLSSLDKTISSEPDGGYPRLHSHHGCLFTPAQKIKDDVHGIIRQRADWCEVNARDRMGG